MLVQDKYIIQSEGGIMETNLDRIVHSCLGLQLSPCGHDRMLDMLEIIRLFSVMFDKCYSGNARDKKMCDLRNQLSEHDMKYTDFNHEHTKGSKKRFKAILHSCLLTVLYHGANPHKQWLLANAIYQASHGISTTIISQAEARNNMVNSDSAVHLINDAYLDYTVFDRFGLSLSYNGEERMKDLQELIRFIAINFQNCYTIPLRDEKMCSLYKWLTNHNITSQDFTHIRNDTERFHHLVNICILALTYYYVKCPSNQSRITAAILSICI